MELSREKNQSRTGQKAMDSYATGRSLRSKPGKDEYHSQ